MTYELSASSLKLIKECPACFWWQVKKGIRRPTGPMSQLPNRVEEQILGRFHEYRLKGKLPPELSELKDVKLIKDAEQHKEWKNKGITHTDEKRNFRAKAKPDDVLVLEHNGKMIILDYKTAGKRAESCREEVLIQDIEKYNYNLQIDLYNYVFRKNKINTEDYAYLLFWFVKGIDSDGKIIPGSKLIKVKVDIKNAEKVLNQAVEILKKEEPPDCGCGFCLSAESRYKQGLKEN